MRAYVQFDYRTSCLPYHTVPEDITKVNTFRSILVLCVCVRACVRACVCVCVRACVRACVCVIFLFSFPVCYLFICISLQFGGMTVEIR